VQHDELRSQRAEDDGYVEKADVPDGQVDRQENSGSDENVLVCDGNGQET